MQKHNTNLDKIKMAVRMAKLKDISFSTEVAKEVCRVPYRRFSDWDRKNILPHRDKEGWRTFNGYDLLIIKIISLLRDNGIPINKIKKISNWLNIGKKIESAVESILLGNDIYIATNLEDKHLILSENDFKKSKDLAETVVIAFKLNPIVGKLLKELKI